MSQPIERNPLAWDPIGDKFLVSFNPKGYLRRVPRP